MIGYEKIHTHALTRPDGLALADRSTTLTWAQLAARVAAATRSLAALLPPAGARPRIAVLGASTVDVVVLQSAAATLRVPLVGIDHSLPDASVAGCLAQIRPAVLAASPERVDLAARALALVGDVDLPPVLLALGPGPAGDRPGWTQWTPGSDGRGSDDPATAPADLVPGWQAPPFEGLGFTSGTSGLPKLVLRSRSFEARRHQDVVDRFEVTARDVYLNTVPLFHASAAGWARVFLTEGAPVVVAGELPAADMLRLAARHGATASLMVPPTLAAVVAALQDDATVPAPPLRMLVTGGRQVSPALVRDVVDRWGHVLHVYYGTTETGLNTLALPADLAEDPTTVGRPFPGNDITVIDAAGRPVPPGTAGTVAIGGYMLADGFATASAPLVAVEGRPYWRTADTGRIDAHGRLTVLGRDLDGRSYDVVGTEARLRELPCLRDAAVHVAVTPRPSAVAAYVRAGGEPGDGAGARLDEIVTRTVAATLGIADVRTLPVARIPYSPSGKVRFAELAALRGAVHDEPAAA